MTTNGTAPDAMEQSADALALVARTVADFRRNLVAGGAPAEFADELARDFYRRTMDQAFKKPEVAPAPAKVDAYDTVRQRQNGKREGTP